MTAIKLKRLAPLLVAVMGVLAILASSASAAGPPIITTGGGPTSRNVATEEFGGVAVNPNGGATEIRTEYSDGTYGTQANPWQSIGSGSSSISAPQTIRVRPDDVYSVWLVAKNSFGTTEASLSGGMETPDWVVNKKLGTSSFITTGTFKLEFTASTVIGRVECAESGSGALGHLQASGDTYTVNATSCSYYQGTKFICHPPNMTLRFDGAFLSTESPRIRFCPEDETTSLLAMSGPSSLSLTGKNLASHPLTLTQPVSINNGWPGTVTISTEMSLSGENNGLTFGYLVNN